MADSILNNWPWFFAGWATMMLWAKGNALIKDLIRRHDAAMLELTLRAQRDLHEHLDVVESTVTHVIDALKHKPAVPWYTPCGYNSPPRTFQ